MRQKIKKSKKAALEMSISTIVIIVIAVTMLILGLILVRTIMCSAMGLTEETMGRARGEIEKLFRETGGEVQCVGSGANPVTLVPGKTNIVHCMVRATQSARYSIELSSSDFNGRPVAREWIKTEKWTSEVPPGDIPAKVVRLNIPSDAPEGLLVLRLKVTKDGQLIIPQDLDFEVKRAGWVTSTMC